MSEGDKMTLDFNEYQTAAMTFALYKSPLYPILGLAEEAGEVTSLFAKSLRGDNHVDETKLAKELGDVLWMVAAIAAEHDLRLADIATANIAKLSDRQRRNKIQGSGDER